MDLAQRNNPRMVGRVASPTFVGRRHELDRVEAAMAAAREGRPAVVLIAGEAGVGKTRFSARSPPVRVRRAPRCSKAAASRSAREGLPFGPLIEALRGLGRDLSPAELDALLGIGPSSVGPADAATSAR